VRRFKWLAIEIHRRAIWQALTVYAIGAGIAYLLIRGLTSGLGLPPWLPNFAAILFVGLLPVVLIAAVVREEDVSSDPAPYDARYPGRARHEPTAETRPAPPVGRGRRVFTWRRVLLGLTFVLALWSVAAAAWLFVSTVVHRGGETSELGAIRTKLVVLPFENLGDAEDEYFADGVTEEVTSRLSEIPELGVISRTSAMQYKDTPKSLSTIAEELDVQYVLHGTIRWERLANGRSQVRVTPQLVRVADGTNVWSEQYDAILSEIFRVQTAIAENVALALDIALLSPQRRNLTTTPTDNLEAYDYYLRGNELYGRRFVEADTWAAVDLYERAVELDPGFALAYAALGRARVWLNSQFGRSAELPRARQAVERALQLAPDLVEAHMALGDYHYYGRLDYDRALEQYLWVQRRQPGNSDAAALIAWIQRRQGDWESSIINAERALELDPRNTVWVAGQAQNYFYTRQYSLAETYFQRAIALAADVPYYHRWAAWLYLAWDGTTDRAYSLLQRSFYRIDPAQLLVGSEASWIILNVFGEDYAPTLERLTVDEPGIDSAYYYLAKAHVNGRTGQTAIARTYYDSARVVLETRLDEGPRHLAPHSALGIALAGLGEREAAVRHGQLGVQLLSVSRDGVTGPNRVIDLARIYVMVGEHEAAIDQIEYLLSIPAPISAALLRVDPFWDPLRSYARFQALVEIDRSEDEGEEGVPTRRTVTRTSTRRT
jgi:serine/threonine-protein kinase